MNEWMKSVWCFLLDFLLFSMTIWIYDDKIKYFHYNEFASNIPDLVLFFVFIFDFKCVISDQVIHWPFCSFGRPAFFVCSSVYVNLPFCVFFNQLFTLSSSFIHSLSLVWLNKALRLRIATKLVSFIIHVKSMRSFVFFQHSINSGVQLSPGVCICDIRDNHRASTLWGTNLPIFLLSCWWWTYDRLATTNLDYMKKLGGREMGKERERQEQREWDAIVTLRVGPGTGLRLIQVCFSIFLFMNCTESFTSLSPFPFPFSLFHHRSLSLTLFFIWQMYGNHFFIFSLYNNLFLKHQFYQSIFEHRNEKHKNRKQQR